MIKFELVYIESFKTKTKVFELIREGKNLFEDFIKDIEKDKNLVGELSELDLIIEYAANGILLPQNRFRKIHSPRQFTYKIFEAKSKHLRVYLTHDPHSGKIIVLGGKKINQKSDLHRVLKILKEYSMFKSYKL